MSQDTSFDVIIVGAGPAGLSAALVLGRCCRNVLVCDGLHPRNWTSKHMHGFIGHEGISPREFAIRARKQLAALGTVVFWDDEVTAAAPRRGGFEIITEKGRSAQGRKLLLATGVRDELPPLPGATEFFGTSLFQCPYCDGWETRGQRTAIYGQGNRGFTMVRALSAWSRHLLLFTDGPADFSESERALLQRRQIPVYEERVECLEGEGGQLQAVRLRSGERVACDFMFFNMPCHQQSDLAASLGCSFTQEGGIKTGRYEATNIPGLYVAGNMIKDVHLAVVAAAEGAKAAMGINKALTREDFERGDASPTLWELSAT